MLRSLHRHLNLFARPNSHPDRPPVPYLVRSAAPCSGRPKGSLGKSKLDGKEGEIRKLLEKEVSRRSLAKIMDGIKGASAHKVNEFLERKGRVWQTESFDHVLRSSEGLDDKIQYALENPVRRGLVADWADYRWLWRKPFINPFAL